MSPRQTHQLLFISEFDVRHVSGAENIIAIALSRVDIIVMPTSFDMQEIAEAQASDDELQQLKQSTSTSLKLKKFPYRKQHPIFTVTLQKKRSNHTLLDHYEDEFLTWCIKCLIQAAEQLTGKLHKNLCGPPWLKTLKSGPAPVHARNLKFLST